MYIAMNDISKHASKRTSFQRENDLLATTRMYLQGYSHQEIAEQISANREYTLTRQQITYDIAKVVEKWQKEYLTDMNKIKARELARIDELEHSYWLAFERSTQDFVTREAERIQDETGTREGNRPTFKREKTKRKEHNRDGDAEFLKGIQWCIEQRMKILGLNAPKQIDISWREQAIKAGADPDSLKGDLVQQFIESARKGLSKDSKDIDENEE